MRRFVAVFLATTLVASSALADTSAPLAAGKPAGVHNAELAGNGLLILFGLAIVAGGIALVTTEGSGNKITNTTTTTTP